MNAEPQTPSPIRLLIPLSAVQGLPQSSPLRDLKRLSIPGSPP